MNREQRRGQRRGEQRRRVERGLDDWSKHDVHVCRLPFALSERSRVHMSITSEPCSAGGAPHFHLWIEWEPAPIFDPSDREVDAYIAALEHMRELWGKAGAQGAMPISAPWDRDVTVER